MKLVKDILLEDLDRDKQEARSDSATTEQIIADDVSKDSRVV